MNPAEVHIRINDFLRDLTDEGTFRMRKKTGHPVCVASCGGAEGSYVLCWTPGSVEWANRCCCFLFLLSILLLDVVLNEVLR